MAQTEEGKVERSTIYNISTHIVSAGVYALSACLAWIPILGYFTWLLPFAVFFFESRSNFVRFCAAQALCIGVVRLIIDIVFDSIASIAVKTVAMYGTDPAFIKVWGQVTNPGAGAILIGNIFGLLLTGIALFCAFSAYNRRLVMLPPIDKLSERIVRAFKPGSKHIIISNRF